MTTESKIPSILYSRLMSGTTYSFKETLHDSLPLACIGVYTIWRGNEFVYVGIAGRNLDLSFEHKRMRGVRDRLDSHRSGRRSGDQFAVYVCDRFVLPDLTREDIMRVAAGDLSLDAKTRLYIHQYLAYRFVEVGTYREAMKIEAALARGESPAGKPVLNPVRSGTLV